MSGKKPTDPGDDKEPGKRRPRGSRKKDRPSAKKVWEDRSVADAQGELDRTEKLRQLGLEAHHVSAYPGLSDRERRAQLRKFKSAIKKAAPEAFECDVAVAELLEAGG